MNTHVSQLQQEPSRASANGSPVHQSVGQRSAVGTAGTAAVETLQRKLDASPGVQGGEQIQRSLNQSAAVAQRCGGGSRSTYQRSTEGVVQGDFLRSMRLARGMLGRSTAMPGQNLARSMAFSNMGAFSNLGSLGGQGMGTRSIGGPSHRYKYGAKAKKEREERVAKQNEVWERFRVGRDYKSVTEMAKHVDEFPEGMIPEVLATLKSKDGDVVHAKNSQRVDIPPSLMKIADSCKEKLGPDAPDFNYHCAEMNAVAEAINKGIDVRGATIKVINFLYPSLRGTDKDPCPLCEQVLKRLGITVLKD